MLERVAIRLLQFVFGSGANISDANPLPVDISPGASSYEEDSDTGATTGVWADALDWDTRQLGNKTIVLKNTDGANSLNYRVYTRAYHTGQNFEEIASTTLAPGASTRIALNNHYARVIVQVIDTTAPNHANYQIDHIGGKF